MPEITIRYKNKRTLEALLDIARYFDFSVIMPSRKEGKTMTMNGVTLLAADSSVDTTGMENIFTARKLDAGEIRLNAWQRRK